MSAFSQERTTQRGPNPSLPTLIQSGQTRALAVITLDLFFASGFATRRSVNEKLRAWAKGTRIAADITK